MLALLSATPAKTEGGTPKIQDCHRILCGFGRVPQVRAHHHSARSPHWRHGRKTPESLRVQASGLEMRALLHSPCTSAFTLRTTGAFDRCARLPTAFLVSLLQGLSTAVEQLTGLTSPAPGSIYQGCRFLAGCLPPKMVESNVFSSAVPHPKCTKLGQSWWGRHPFPAELTECWGGSSELPTLWLSIYSARVPCKPGHLTSTVHSLENQTGHFIIACHTRGTLSHAEDSQSPCWALCANCQ